MRYARTSWTEQSKGKGTVRKKKTLHEGKTRRDVRKGKSRAKMSSIVEEKTRLKMRLLGNDTSEQEEAKKSRT